MNARHLAAICLPALLGLAACAQPATAPASHAVTYTTDMAGKAALCTAPAVSVKDGQDATGAIATGGGGWCGIPVSRDGQPLTAALLTQPPRNGAVYVHTVGDDTRVDYTPRGAPAADSFALKFIPGDETMKVTVTAAGAAK